MFCSTIIPTIGRASLTQAVESVLNQDFTDLEVIVVNDSDKPLPAANWMASPRVRVLESHRQERSIARNLGAQVASGLYLHFLDDDDWMLPGAFTQFARVAEQTNAGFLFGRFRIVDRQGNLIDEMQYDHTELVRPSMLPLLHFEQLLRGNCALELMAGEFIPLMACLFRADIFGATEGFYPFITCGEDMDLCRHAAIYSDLVYVPELVTCITLGSAGSTTDRRTGVQQMQLARERILDKAVAYPRLVGSAYAGHSSHWFGRLARIYLSSAGWNFKRGRWGTALRRGQHAAQAGLQHAANLFETDFWSGVRYPYTNGQYIRAFLRAYRD